MSAVLEREILEALKEINSKLDALVARLEALEEKVVGAEKPEPEDGKKPPSNHLSNSASIVIQDSKLTYVPLIRSMI